MNNLHERSGRRSLRKALAAFLSLTLVSGFIPIIIHDVAFASSKPTTPSISVTRAATGKLSLRKGATYSLGVKATGTKTTYKTSNPKVVSVSKKGKLRAKKIGRATITITSKTSRRKSTKKIKVSVLSSKKYKKAKRITAKCGKKVLVKGQKATIKVSFKPKGASNKNLIYKSSNPKVLSVSAKGTVTAKKAGSATVTITSCDNKKAKAKITFRVCNPAKPNPVPSPFPAPSPMPNPQPVPNPYQVDSDGDGYPDYIEKNYMGTDPGREDDTVDNKIVYSSEVNRISAAAMDDLTLSQTARTPIPSDVFDVTVPTTEGGYSIGQVLTIEPCSSYPAGASIKITSFKDNGDGTFTLSGTRPDLTEVISYASIEEEIQPSWNDIICADGVTAEIIEEHPESKYASAASGSKAGFKNGKTTIKFTLGKDENEVFTHINGNKTTKDKEQLEGYVKVTIDKVNFSTQILPKFDYKGFFIPGATPVGLTVKKFNVGIDGEAEAVLEAKGSQSTDIVLAEVPVWGVLGEGVYFKINLHFERNGTASVTYSTDYNFGTSYQKGSSPKWTANLSNSDLEFQMKGSAKANIDAKIAAELFGIEVASVGIDPGLEASFSKTLHSYPSMSCVDVAGWFRAGYYAKLLPGLDWAQTKWSHDIYDKKNSPLKMSLHWENDILVGSSEDCTWEADPPKGDFTNFEQKDPALSDNGFSSTPSLSNHTGSSSYYNKLDEPFNVNAGHTVTVGGDGHSAIAIGYDCDPGTVFKLTKIDWSGNILSESLNYRVTSGYPGYGDVIWKIEVLCGRVIVDNVTGWRPPPVEIADCEQMPYPLQISHSSAQIPVGQTFLLSAQDTFDEITNDEVSLSWTSNNSSVAKVEDGLITALQPGKAIVSVEACNGLYKRSCTVTVY